MFELPSHNFFRFLCVIIPHLYTFEKRYYVFTSPLGVLGQLAERHLADRLLADRLLADRLLADRTFGRQTFGRQDI